MKKAKRYPYKGNEYPVDHLAAILSRENKKSISTTALKNHLNLIAYKYCKDGNFNEFKDGIVEEAYDNFLCRRYPGSKVTVYPYKGKEYSAVIIAKMLEKEGIQISSDVLRKYLRKIENKYKIEGEERKFRDGIVEEACQIYLENNKDRMQRNDER